MQKNKLIPSLKLRRPYLVLCCVLPFAFAMCHEQERVSQRNKLDNKISTLDKTIAETQDFYTAKVPQNLRGTQSRYIMASDSLDMGADTVGACMAHNDDLVMMAFNNYAVRIGRDFQISKFLPAGDIAVFKKYITNMDSAEFILNMARTRILADTGSLNDLSYFFEMMDFDSVNSQLKNKLMWNFYTDSNAIDDEQDEVSMLTFDSPVLNNALMAEKKLLDNAWKKNTLQTELNKNDSLRMRSMENITDSAQCAQTNAKFDSLQSQIISEFKNMNGYEPNFAIPEFDSVHAQYMQNDSLIKVFYKTFDDMLEAENTLKQYRQTIIHERDSLIKKRKELEK